MGLKAASYPRYPILTSVKVQLSPVGYYSGSYFAP